MGADAGGLICVVSRRWLKWRQRWWLGDRRGSSPAVVQMGPLPLPKHKLPTPEKLWERRMISSRPRPAGEMGLPAGHHDEATNDLAANPR